MCNELQAVSNIKLGSKETDIYSYVEGFKLYSTRKHIDSNA